MKKNALIASEATLLGLTGVVGIDVAKAKFDACYQNPAPARLFQIR